MGFPKRISDLPNAGSLKNSDIFVLVNENDVTSQTTLGTIAGMVSGGSSTFTGNTLATCIDQLWVHSISGCSPIQLGEIVVNGETTFNGNVNLSPDFQTNIDFDNADTVSIPTYVLKDCKGLENDIVTLQNFSEYVGQVVTLASEGPTRWEVTLQPTLEVISIEECCFDNFKISNCDTGELWNIVNWEAWAGTGFIGTIIKIEDVEGCFSVSATCEEWTYDAKVLVSGEYDTCIECTTTPFTLIPCDGWEGEIIFTNTDLSAYVGGVIKELETGICYNVEDCVGPCEPTIPILYEELVYIDCDECKDNWQLTNCLGEVVGITTTQSDLWEPGFAFSSSTTDGCFTVDKIKEPANVGELENIIVVDCLSIECVGEPPTTYKLTGCDGLTEFFTDTDLSEYVGSYIHAETTPPQGETCFYVIEEEGESTYEIVGEPQAIYTEEEGCDCCGQNPKWKYSECDDEAEQVVWENTALGPLGIYAPPPCVRMSTDEGETWKCYNFMLCVPEEEPTEGITNFEVLEECCENWPCWNFILNNCEGDFLGISDQNLSDFDGLQLSGSNSTHSFSGQCFTIEMVPEGPATLGPLDTSDWVEITCTEWPCTNYMITPCTEGVVPLTVRQDLSDYLFDVSGIMTGTTFEESLCFTVSTTFDSPDVPPVDTSSWGSLGIEIVDCGEDPPCQE